MKMMSWFSKSFIWLLAHAIEVTIALVMCIVALASFYIFQSLVMKLTAFICSLLVGYLAAYYLGKLHGEGKR